MCIVCEIKADLSKSKATAEEGQAIVKKVEKLARCMGDVIDAVEAAHARTPDVFNADELATIAKAEELFTAQAEGMAGGLGALLLAALLAAVLGGNLSVEVMHVTPNEGESPDEAIRRALAERETANVTKH